MDYTVHGILQARTLEWVAFAFSRGSSQPRDLIQVSCVAGRLFSSWVSRKPKNTGVGGLSLLQPVFPTWGWNRRPLHGRQILYPLSYQGSPHSNLRCELSQRRTRRPWGTDLAGITQRCEWRGSSDAACGSPLLFVQADGLRSSSHSASPPVGTAHLKAQPRLPFPFTSLGTSVQFSARLGSALCIAWQLPSGDGFWLLDSTWLCFSLW